MCKITTKQKSSFKRKRTAEVDKKLSSQMKIFVGRELKIRDLEKRIRALTGKA